MSEKPKEEIDDHESLTEAPEKADESSWGKDIMEHDYYYDDAHGYEVFEPDDGEDEADE